MKVLIIFYIVQGRIKKFIFICIMSFFLENHQTLPIISFQKDTQDVIDNNISQTKAREETNF